MKQISFKKSSLIGPCLSGFGMLCGAIAGILSWYVNHQIGINIGIFSFVFGIIGVLIYCDVTYKTYMHRIDEYKTIHMGSFQLVIVSDSERKQQLIATFFTEHAYSKIKNKEPIKLKSKFKYFSFNETTPNISTMIIGEEEVFVTRLKTWNPKV